MKYEFFIQNKSVSCSSCNEVFMTPVNFKLPDMTESSPVEADLHRVLPYGAIRACMVTICPSCQYAWWTNTFAPHFFLPVGLTPAPVIDSAKKFAHAIFTGRKSNFHLLDRALLALNGYWCAKENHDETSKWLTLTIQELSTALADQSWQGNRARYYYLLAELLRLSGRCEEALERFALVDDSAQLPQDLIDNQKRLAGLQNSDSVLLTNEQVKTIFFKSVTTTIQVDSSNSAVPLKRNKTDKVMQIA